MDGGLTTLPVQNIFIIPPIVASVNKENNVYNHNQLLFTHQIHNSQQLIAGSIISTAITIINYSGSYLGTSIPARQSIYADNCCLFDVNNSCLPSDNYSPKTTAVCLERTYCCLSDGSCRLTVVFQQITVVCLERTVVSLLEVVVALQGTEVYLYITVVCLVITVVSLLNVVIYCWKLWFLHI